MRTRYGVNCQKSGMFALLGEITPNATKRDKKTTTLVAGETPALLFMTADSPVVVEVVDQPVYAPEKLREAGYQPVLKTVVGRGLLSLTHDIANGETVFFQKRIPKSTLSVVVDPTRTHFIFSFSNLGSETVDEVQVVATPPVSKWLEEDSSYEHSMGTPQNRFIAAFVGTSLENLELVEE